MNLFFTLLLIQKNKIPLGPNDTMWLSYNTTNYKHVPVKFLRRKRNEKSRQKQICNKPFVFVSHHQTFQEMFFTVS